MTLTEFLLARVAEDEEVARAATDGPWRVHVDGEFTSVASEVPDPQYGGRMTVIDASGEFCGSGPTVDATDEDLAHIVRWDPARVRDECEAKRRIVEKLLATKHEVVDGDCWFTCAAATEDRDGGTCCDDSRRGTGCDCGRDARVESYLRLLALPYATHPDYDPAWAL